MRSIQHLLDLADKHFARKEFPKAITTYLEIIQKEKEFALAYYRLGECHFNTGDQHNAVKYFKIAEKYVFFPIGTLYYLSKILIDIRNYSEAEHFLTKLFEIEETQKVWQSWNLKGIIAERKGEYETAEQCFKKTISLEKNQPQPWHNLGIVYRKKAYEKDQRDKNKFLDQAISAFTKALELNNNYPLPMAELGGIYLAEGDFVKARGFVEKALSIDPDNWEAKITLGFVNNNEMKYEQARIIVEDIIDNCPKHVMKDRQEILDTFTYIKKNLIHFAIFRDKSKKPQRCPFCKNGKMTMNKVNSIENIYSLKCHHCRAMMLILNNGLYQGPNIYPEIITSSID
ncbi:MAG: Photosystem I assembly protein Ycf3 [Candidatus Heimdallarchaeota archaeon LC_3]|nr:MAG: Photosystem I assembly protein Ycf3 [Candidatus Heimdallarchaeota archaeon LC_3]